MQHQPIIAIHNVLCSLITRHVLHISLAKVNAFRFESCHRTHIERDSRVSGVTGITLTTLIKPHECLQYVFIAHTCVLTIYIETMHPLLFHNLTNILVGNVVAQLSHSLLICSLHTLNNVARFPKTNGEERCVVDELLQVGAIKRWRS